MKIVKLSRSTDVPPPEEIAAMIGSIRLFAKDGKVDGDIRKRIDTLPSDKQLADMDAVQVGLLYETVGYLWRKLTGKRISEDRGKEQSTDMDKLDGNYWLLPGEVILHGFNHFSIAKSHRDMICRLLDINPFIFEHAIQKGTDSLINLVLSKGGVRMMVDRANNTVYMQTSEESWPWARNKLKKMYHRHRVAKVLDPSKPYAGWESGITIIVKSQPEQG
jgi:hypothetical protein